MAKISIVLVNYEKVSVVHFSTFLTKIMPVVLK